MNVDTSTLPTRQLKELDKHTHKDHEKTNDTNT